MKVVALVSGGKDSCFSMQLCRAHGHQVVALANLLPPDCSIDELDSYMYQTVGHQLVAAYAACTGLPLYRRKIHGSSTSQGLSYSRTAGDEVEDLFVLLAYIKAQQPDIQAVASGAIASDYQRLRVESVCSRLGLVPLGYLWHQPQDRLLSDMIAANIEAILVKVAAIGLDPYKHLGKSIRHMQSPLRSLRDKFGCNVCGEGGEYETLTLDCPAFKHGRIVLDAYEVVLHSPDSIAPVGVLHPTAFHVEPKTQPDAAGENFGFPQPQKQQQQQQQTSGPSAAVIEVPDSWQPEQAFNSSSTGAVVAATAAAAAWDSTVGLTLSASHVHLTCSTAAQGNSGSSSVKDKSSAATAAGALPAAGTAAALEAALLAVTAQLPGLGLQWSNSCFVHLYLADMTHFGMANDVYCKHLPQVDPPSRACVQVPLPQGCPVLLDVLFARPGSQHTQPLVTAGDQHQQQQQESALQQQQQHSPDRRVLHVQSISSWAPSCIGPYSQATTCNGLIYMAGQIPLDPASMAIAPPSPNGMAATIAMQTWRTLCSCQAVAIAVRSCFATAAVGLTVYVSEACAAAGGQRIVQAALEAVWADRSLLDCLQIPAAVLQAVAAAAEQGSIATAAAAAVQCMRIEDSGGSGCDSDDDGNVAGLQFIDDYLKPPTVPCALQPAVVYVTVPALPRGALLEVQPLLLDLSASEPPFSGSSEEEHDDIQHATVEDLAGVVQYPTLGEEASVAAGLGTDVGTGDACGVHVTSTTSGDRRDSWRRVLVHLAEIEAAATTSSSCEQQAVAAGRQLISAVYQHGSRDHQATSLRQVCSVRCWHTPAAGGERQDRAWQHALETTVQQILSRHQQQITVQFVPVTSVASAGHTSACWAVVEAYFTL